MTSFTPEIKLMKTFLEQASWAGVSGAQWNIGAGAGSPDSACAGHALALKLCVKDPCSSSSGIWQILTTFLFQMRHKMFKSDHWLELPHTQK